MSDAVFITKQTAQEYPGVVCVVGSFRVVVGRGALTDENGGFYFRLQVSAPLRARRKGDPWVLGWLPVPDSSATSLARFRLKLAPLPDVLAALGGLPDDPRCAAPQLLALFEALDAVEV